MTIARISKSNPGLLLGLFVVIFAAGVPLCAAYAGHFTTLYHFRNGPDGESPTGLVQNSAGALYGATAGGGPVKCHIDCTNFGSVFSFTVAGGLKTLAYFNGPNGNTPVYTLLLHGRTLYGNTSMGGADNDGVIFALQTDGSGFTLLHQFDGADGKMPDGTPQLGADGALYGVTYSGGRDNYGVLFSIAKNGTYTILHNFTGGTDGANPDSLLIAPSGELFGSTFVGGDVAGCAAPTGCGVIFSYTPATGQFAVAHTVQPGSTASPLLGSIGPGPTVYGTTAGIAVNQIFALGPKGFNAENIIYLDTGTQVPGPKLAPDKTLFLSIGELTYYAGGLLLYIKNDVVKRSVFFNGSYNKGGTPEPPLVTSTGVIYGTTGNGGACYACGTIYEITQ